MRSCTCKKVRVIWGVKNEQRLGNLPEQTLGCWEWGGGAVGQAWRSEGPWGLEKLELRPHSKDELEPTALSYGEVRREVVWKTRKNAPARIHNHTCTLSWMCHLNLHYKDSFMHSHQEVNTKCHHRLIIPVSHLVETQMKSLWEATVSLEALQLKKRQY
jgi:hypothetical protein